MERNVINHATKNSTFLGIYILGSFYGNIFDGEIIVKYFRVRSFWNIPKSVKPILGLPR